MSEKRKGETTEDAPHVMRRAGRFARLTERDRQLLAVLVMARYLSTAQVGRLFFPGRHESIPRRRLGILWGGRDRQLRAPYLVRHTFRTYEGGPESIWAPADRAYLVAHYVLGEPRQPPTTAEVGAEYLEHVVSTNELLVGLLLPKAGASVAAAHRGFHWLSADSLRLCFDHFDLREGRARARVIVPDATVELPFCRVRAFIEYESGAHLLSDPANEGSTTSKLHRYERYLSGLADASKGLTWYRKEFADELSPEVLFVAATPARRDSINSVIAGWRNSSSGRSRARALCVGEAIAELRARAGSPAAGQPAPRVEPEPRPGLDEREVKALRTFGDQAVAIIKGVRHAVRRGDRISKEPAYPAAYGAFEQVLKRIGAKP